MDKMGERRLTIASLRRASYVLAAVLLWVTDISKAVLTDPLYVGWRDKRVDHALRAWAFPYMEQVATDLDKVSDQAYAPLREKMYSAWDAQPDERTPNIERAELEKRHFADSDSTTFESSVNALERMLEDQGKQALVFSQQLQILDRLHVQRVIEDHQVGFARFKVDWIAKQEVLGAWIDRRTSLWVLLGRVLAGAVCACAWWLDERGRSESRGGRLRDSSQRSK